MKGEAIQTPNNHDNKINYSVKEHIQSVADKVINSLFKGMGINDKKQVSFKVDEANAKSWIEETVKNISNHDGSVDATLMEEIFK